MKVAFLDTIGLLFNGKTLEERGLGGSESAIIYLSEELHKIGFDVTVFNKCDNEGTFNGVRYLDLSRASENEESFDILISSRTVLPFVPSEYEEEIFERYPLYNFMQVKPLVERSYYKVLWLHDTFILGEEYVEDLLSNNYYNEIFTLSDFHTQYIPNARHGQPIRHFEAMKRKIYQTRNGIKSFYDEVDIQAKNKNLFVYNASTTKGMVPLLDTIWPKFHEENPKTELKIIGGFYSNVNPNELDEIERVWHEKREQHEGKNNVSFTGVITQKEIAKILVEASYFIYPGAFPETFGISATEALNYNVPLITTRFGALEETAPEETSYLIDFPITRTIENYSDEGSIADPLQTEKFLEIVNIAYHDDYLRQQKMNAANEYKKFLGWDTVALQWKQHFYYRFGLFMPVDETKEVLYRTHRLHQLFKRRFINEEHIIEDYSQYNKNDIIVISPVYNAENFIENNILSVASQLYNQYHHIIIDDMSTDNTYEVAKSLIESFPAHIREGFTLIKNQEKNHALANQVKVLNNIKGNPIIVLLDGDDWLVNDPYVFEFINREYEMGAKFTYGSCFSLADSIELIAQEYPKKVHENKSYTEHHFNWVMPYTHLRTFKKELFDKIDQNIFLDENGDFWTSGGDNALFYPLMQFCEMNEIKSIQKILMIYNDINPLNDYKIHAEDQNKNRDKIIKKSKKQKNLKNLLDINNEKLNSLRQEKNTESVKELKEILFNREDVWLDDADHPEIKVRLDYIKSIILEKEKDIKILDLGSWTGTIANEIYKMGYHDITCVDISKSVVDFGKENLPHLKWINQDIEEFDTDEKFDVIITAEILEHLENPKKLINHLKKMLTDDGEIIFTTPTEYYVFVDGSYEHISSMHLSDFRFFTNDIKILDLNEYNISRNYKWYAGRIYKHYSENRKVLKKIAEDKIRILIAMPTAKNIEAETFRTIYNLKVPHYVELDFNYFYGYRIDQVRNLIAHHTIAEGYDYVLFVDSDMVLPDDTLLKMLNFNKEIVTGIYVQRRLDEKVTEVHGVDGHIKDPEFFEDKPYVEAQSTGFGCILIKTDVLREIGYPQFEYHHSIDFKDTLSEDADFCNKAIKAGFKIYVLTDLHFGHIGSFTLNW